MVTVQLRLLGQRPRPRLNSGENFGTEPPLQVQDLVLEVLHTPINSPHRAYSVGNGAFRVIEAPLHRF